MKLRAPLLLLFLSAAVGPTIVAVRGQNQTDAKIRLMGEALTARDAGDFSQARSKLEALSQITPNDPGIRRLLGEIAKNEEDQRIARDHPPAPPPAPIVLPEPSSGAETLVVPNETRGNAERSPPVVSTPSVAPSKVASPVPPTRNPVSNIVPAPNRADTSERLSGISVIEERPVTPPPPPDHFAEALAKVEKEGVAFAQGGENQGEKLMTYVQAQRTLAQAYAKDGNYAEATRTLDEALQSLQSSVDELKSERRGYMKKEVETEEAKKGVRLKRHH